MAEHGKSKRNGTGNGRGWRGVIQLDIRDSTPSWDDFVAKKAPPGAPNVLVVLYDDYRPRFAFSNGEVVKVVFDVGDDVYVDAATHLAAAMARD